jgi:Domain of unknown function (DUF4153)
MMSAEIAVEASTSSFIRDSLRADARDEAWPLRPWIMAAICALACLAFYVLTDAVQDERGGRWAVVGASFVAVAAVSFVLTVEKRRWLWSLGFALAWGLIVGLVSWTTFNYNGRGEVMEFPLLAAIFAVLLACPLFQTARDAGGLHFTSGTVHNHAWTDAVIGAASLVFVGIAFLLAWLIASLFDLIGIDLLEELLKEGAFGWSLAGFAFGAAVGLLRERDALVGTMQRLVMIILGVLAPVLAVALLLFLVSLPVTGLTGLWDGWASAAALMLAAAGGSYLLLNAAIGLGDEDRPTNRALHWAALVLALVVLPLAGLAMAALTLRIGQYGWTPERMWAVLCAGVALAYGAAGWWAVARGRMEFAPLIRSLQTRLALGVCAVALLLALPILDFGAISTRDQLGRLQNGAVKAEEFDWAAMAFDFGPEGRAALAVLGREGPAEQRAAAQLALSAENRWEITERGLDGADAEAAAYLAKPIAEKVRSIPAGRVLPRELLAAVESDRNCRSSPCLAVWLDDERVALVQRGNQFTSVMVRQEDGSWLDRHNMASAAPGATVTIDMIENGDVSFRTVERRQIVIDGQVVGGDIE